MVAISSWTSRYFSHFFSVFASSLAQYGFIAAHPSGTGASCLVLLIWKQLLVQFEESTTYCKNISSDRTLQSDKSPLFSQLFSASASPLGFTGSTGLIQHKLSGTVQLTLHPPLLTWILCSTFFWYRGFLACAVDLKAITCTVWRENHLLQNYFKWLHSPKVQGTFFFSVLSQPLSCFLRLTFFQASEGNVSHPLQCSCTPGRGGVITTPTCLESATAFVSIFF